MLGPPATASSFLDTLAAEIERQHLTTLKRECLSFEANDDARLVSYTVREKHSGACAGDPATSPRLFTIAIDTTTGSITSDAQSADGTMKVIRPPRRH